MAGEDRVSLGFFEVMVGPDGFSLATTISPETMAVPLVLSAVVEFVAMESCQASGVAWARLNEERRMEVRRRVVKVLREFLRSPLVAAGGVVDLPGVRTW